MYGTFVESTENYGNLPLPLMLKIKNGVLFLPFLYPVTDGLGSAMKKSLSQLHTLNSQLYKVIMNNNLMTDKAMSQLLQGCLKRPELISLTSIMNEIGHEAAHHICRMLDRKYGQPKTEPVSAAITERDMT